MKRTVVLLVVCLFASAADVSAQEKGFIQKLKERFGGKQQASRAVPAPAAAPVSAPAAAPAVESQPRQTPEAVVETAGLQKMTREEMLKDLADTLDDEDEVLGAVPELKKETDPEGKIFYTYNGTRLQDLDLDTLRGLYNKVNRQIAMINTNRINEQLEVIRNAQNAARLQQRTVVPAPPTVPASAPRVPQTPRTPPPPPAPPKR